MNTMHICGVALGAAVLLLPSVLIGQTDPNMNPSVQPSFPQSQSNANQQGSAINPTQAQSASMRDSLGNPGEMGQQILDKQFVRTAVEDGLADVKLSTLAVQKGGPDVKEAAQKMMDDHTAMNKEMDTIADTLGVMVPKKVNKETQAEYDKLNGLSGKDFDTEYLTFVLKAHWANLHTFYMEASVAADPDLQSHVVKGLGMMHEHLGVIAKAATAEGITLPPRPPRPQRPAATTAKK